MGLQHRTRLLHLVNKEIVAAFFATNESKALQAEDRVSLQRPWCTTTDGSYALIVAPLQR